MTLSDRQARSVAHELVAGVALGDRLGLAAGILGIETDDDLRAVVRQLTELGASLVRPIAEREGSPIAEILDAWRAADPQLQE